jgi:Mg/Co/Ni transporter MgtE
MIQNPEHLQQPVMTVARRDVATLRQDLSVHEALEAIRGRELGEKIVHLKLDPKIAAGPVTLAFTDIFTLLFYFGVAAWLL